MDFGKISIGPPWYSIAFVIPMLPLVFLMGIGMHTAWRYEPANLLAGRLRVPATAAIALGILIPGLLYGRFGLMAFWCEGGKLG